MKRLNISLITAILLICVLCAYGQNLGIINNGLVIRLTTITDADTPFALLDEAYLICDTTNSAITVNLPAAATVIGRIYWIKNSGAVASDATIDANGSELIDGVLIVILKSKESITIVSDGTGYHIM